MRWEVVGADRQTGRGKRIEVEGATEAEAVKRAGLEMLVESIKAKPSPPPPPSLRTAPPPTMDYASPTAPADGPTGAEGSVRTTALRRCRDCGRDVSKRATACPHCGAPVRGASPILVVGRV